MAGQFGPRLKTYSIRRMTGSYLCFTPGRVKDRTDAISHCFNDAEDMPCDGALLHFVPTTTVTLTPPSPS
eukprot:105783-Hanusia_phi.AAC.1